MLNNHDMIKFETLPPDILSRVSEAKQLLLQEKSVVFAYLFGGLASGRAKPLSDVDIAVYVSVESGLDDYYLELFDKLSETLGTSELDLVFLNTGHCSKFV
jgi:predicted nucleotidyltransferase